jgi:two-component system sensor histidine kinase YesM
VYQGIPFTHIQTTYRIENGKLSITVTDDGPEMPKQEREELVSTLRTKETGKSSHIGLRNINARINLLYGKTYGLSLVTVAKGFSVNVILPLLSEE